MLRDDVIDNGYALLCVSMPTSDLVEVEVIEEEVRACSTDVRWHALTLTRALHSPFRNCWRR